MHDNRHVVKIGYSMEAFMRIKYLLVLALIGCSTAQEIKPVATKPSPPFVRHITSKTHLLYTYRLRTERATGYELAEADATQVCKTKWGLQAYESIQPNCVTNDNNEVMCAVTFACR